MFFFISTPFLGGGLISLPHSHLIDCLFMFIHVFALFPPSFHFFRKPQPPSLPTPAKRTPLFGPTEPVAELTTSGVAWIFFWRGGWVKGEKGLRGEEEKKVGEGFGGGRKDWIFFVGARTG